MYEGARRCTNDRKSFVATFLVSSQVYKNHYLINNDVIVLIIEMDAKSGLLMLLWSYKRVPNVVGVESTYQLLVLGWLIM